MTITPIERTWTTREASNGTVIGSFEGGYTNEDEAPIVLLPGIGCGANSLRLLARELDLHNHEVITADARHLKTLGHLALMGTYGRAVKDAAKEKLGDRPAVVMGHSWGGILAQRIAVDSPEWVEKLGIIASYSGGVPMYPPSPRNQLRMVWPNYSRERLIDICGKLYGGQDLRNNPDLIDSLGMSEDISKTSTIRQAMAVAALNVDLLYKIGKIEAPTLVIAGKDDRVVPYRNSQEIHRRIAGSVLELIPLAGHMVPITQAEQIADIIDKFVNPNPIDFSEVYPIDINLQPALELVHAVPDALVAS